VSMEPRYNQQSIKRLLESNGWTETQGGKHVVKMTKPGHRPITCPTTRGAAGTLSACLTQSSGRLRSPEATTMAARGEEVYTVRVHHEPGEALWAEVLELPGVFATGTDMEDLRQALTEAISMYLSEPVELEDEPGSITEHRMLARTA
jgi:predicted RNase H-like HicB family nuclease